MSYRCCTHDPLTLTCPCVEHERSTLHPFGSLAPSIEHAEFSRAIHLLRLRGAR